MFRPPPGKKDLAEMAAAGLTPEDFGGGEVEVWPENERAFFLFGGLQTQWRAGAMGLVGLDYNVLYKKMDRMALSAEEYDELESEICVMEFAALAAMGGGIDTEH